MVPNFGIIPQPVSIEPGTGRFCMTDDTSLIVECDDQQDDYRDAAKFAEKVFSIRRSNCTVTIERRSGIIDDVVELSTKSVLGGSFHLRLSNEEDESVAVEGYNLKVAQSGIHVIAKNKSGLFHGIQTVRQLLPSHLAFVRPLNIDVYIPSVTITDQPRFKWRGMHLDVGRHMFPVSFIKRYIDLLAMHKFNVFHWHLTDDQGWRIEIENFPELMSISAWRDESPIPSNRQKGDGKRYGGYYTKQQIRDIVSHAEKLNITVVPELELPGHTVAVLAAYPQFGCVGHGYKVRTTWGVSDDVFCAGCDEVFKFLHTVFDEILALFPSEFIHIGGDECPKTRWKSCQKCQARKRKIKLQNDDELQSWFIARIASYLHERGRRVIGWDEILEGEGHMLPSNAAVMSWRGTAGGIEAASRGRDVVMTPTSHCYLDYYQTKEIDKEPPAGGGLLTLKQAYAFDPLDGVPPMDCPFIIGGQGNLWTEYISTSKHVEYMAYPRGCALSEALWSPTSISVSKLCPDKKCVMQRTFKEFTKRLSLHLDRLDAFKVAYRYPNEDLPIGRNEPCPLFSKF